MPLIPAPCLSPDDLTEWARLERMDRALAQAPALARKADRAIETMANFWLAGGGYLGVSWGKDSMVVVHMAAELARRGVRIPCVWVRVEPIKNPFCHLVRDAFLVRFDVDYHEIEEWCAKDDEGWHAKGTIERGFARAAADFGARHVSGVRGEESGMRKARMRRYGCTSQNTCAPIGWWSGVDVFAYLARYDLPVHPAYAMSFGGQLDRIRLRVASLGGQRGTGWGRREHERVYYREHMAALGLDCPQGLG